MAVPRRRLLAVGFACLLVLLVGAERRLAEVHLNRVSASAALEDNNLLDGDEIRIRLILVATADVQPVLAQASLAWEPPPALWSDTPPAPAARSSPSRAPPRSRLAR